MNEMYQIPARMGGVRNSPLNPYQNLANAIVAVAADDYRLALKKGNDHLIALLEKFFHSDWYRVLTNVDADELIAAIKKEYQERQISQPRRSDICAQSEVVTKMKCL